MRHHNSVFHQLLKQVPWAEFDRLVEEHGADWRVRRLSTKSQFVALLYGQLSQAASLREIEAGLTSHQARLYHLGAGPVCRSTLADANALRPAEVFCELLGTLMAQAHRGLRRALADTTYLIDSTPLRLDERSARWARFSADVCGAKVHVVYDPDANQPVYAALTNARINDITAAKAMRFVGLNLTVPHKLLAVGMVDAHAVEQIDENPERVPAEEQPLRQSRQVPERHVAGNGKGAERASG